ncbi:MAG TPA: RNA polymerase subunit sigma-70 [Solirubrobacteraceae bacterium]
MSFRARTRHTPMIDEADFTRLAEPHRRELHVHCYRMLANYEEAEDLVQETFLRAWRKRDDYAGRATFRAWLYKIATNACLDAIAKRKPVSGEVLWLQPYPDVALAPREDEPDAVVIEKETIELAYIVAIQHLPATQRAVLILRDVVGWSAKETAELLETSVAAANSTLQRARETMRARLPAQRDGWSASAGGQERALAERYIAAADAGDTAALIAMISEDAVFSMPPEPERIVGNRAMVEGWVSGGFGDVDEFGELRCTLTWANRQPAIANYRRKPGEDTFHLFAIDVLRIEGDRITDITMFGADAVLAAFDVPETWVPA